jgi:hypothetical protein
MEPRKNEEPVESGGEGQPASPRPPERKRRFQVIKLEERIAPKGNGNSGNNHNWHCNTMSYCAACCV